MLDACRDTDTTEGEDPSEKRPLFDAPLLLKKLRRLSSLPWPAD